MTKEELHMVLDVLLERGLGEEKPSDRELRIKLARATLRAWSQRGDYKWWDARAERWQQPSHCAVGTVVIRRTDDPNEDPPKLVGVLDADGMRKLLAE